MSKKLVITGAAGLLGWHTEWRFKSTGEYEVQPLDRDAFNDDAKLEGALKGADAVIHLAGINRDDDNALEFGNIDLAKRLVAALERTDVKPHVIYSNSLHRTVDNHYGRGKAGVNSVLAAWAASISAPYTELVLPHVFGEGGKPFYNSGVHTFCKLIVDGEKLEINPEGRFELLHAGAVAERCIEIIESGETGERVLAGEPIAVPVLAEKLQAMHESYISGVVPDLRNALDLALFNTLRSFLYPEHYPQMLTLHRDNRGSLFEAEKNHNGGQAFLSTTKPGITRGNHYHFNKIERFLVVNGRASIEIRKLGSDVVKSFEVSGDQPCYIDMPTLHTHSITNIGDTEMLTLFWSHEIFDPETPDTFAQPVRN